MDWKILVGLLVLYHYGLQQIAIKKIGAVEGSRTRKLVWQYFFAAILALIVAVATGRLELTLSAAVVAAIGAANAFGCYCHWRAYDISMAKTAMFSNLDDLLAIALGYMLLGELDMLTPLLTAGVVVSVVSAIFFAKMKHRDDETSGKLMGWVIGYSIIWGIAIFSMRFFRIHGLNVPTFIAAWYVGAWVGAMFTRFAMGHNEAGLPLSFGQHAKVFLLAFIIWTTLMLSYWVRGLVPVTVIQPILLVAEMSIPVIIAMVFLGEARDMSRKELAVIAGGIIGVVLIAIGF